MRSCRLHVILQQPIHGTGYRPGAIPLLYHSMPSHQSLAGTQNGDSFHAVVQEAKFRGLNVFDGLSARCSSAHALQPPAPAAAASVSLSVAEPLTSSSLIPAAAEGVALLLQNGQSCAALLLRCCHP
jgi:hypothetical protein